MVLLEQAAAPVLQVLVPLALLKQAAELVPLVLLKQVAALVPLVLLK